MDWKKIVELKKLKAHKTTEGIALIKEIRSKMISNRE